MRIVGLKNPQSLLAKEGKAVASGACEGVKESKNPKPKKAVEVKKGVSKL